MRTPHASAVLLTALLTTPLAATRAAGDVVADPGTRYAIRCQYADGYLATGAAHGSACELYYVTDGTEPADDGEWRIEGNETSGHTITQCSTGLLLTWSPTYQSESKYLTLAAATGGDEQRWDFTNEKNGHYTIYSRAQPRYYFNLRTGTYLVGCYAGTGTHVNRDYYRLEALRPDGLRPEPGHYSVMSARSWSDGTDKALLAGPDGLRWGTWREEAGFIWTLERDANGATRLTTLRGKRQIGPVERSQPVTLSDTNDTPLTLDIAGKNAQDVTIVNIRPSSQPAGGFHYLHCEGHQNGSGTEGNAVGWTTTWVNNTAGASEWYLRPVSEETVRKLSKLVESVTLAPDSLSLRTGNQTRLTAGVLPADADDTSLLWASSDDAVAYVSPDGTVTATGEGKAMVSATARDGGGAAARCAVTVTARYKGTPLAHSGDYLHVTARGGALTAIPLDYIRSRSTVGDRLYVTLVTGKALVIDSVLTATEEAPADMPRFTEYKFNNKYNDQLFLDAAADPASLLGDSATVRVAQIGKWLTASFLLDSEDAVAYVGPVRQRSRVTRQRMEQPVTYTLARRGWRQLQINRPDSTSYSYDYLPYGRAFTVRADFLTDHSAGGFLVPRVDITTSTGQVPMSKTVFIDGTITIQGWGVFPDMPETPMHIKGRGNSSWSQSASSKNPYNIKFDTKQKPLGMTKGKRWVLLANKQTGSMTTNAMEQKMAALAGCAAPCHIVPVELYVNGVYRGSYNLTEKVGIANNSVALDDESCAAMLELDTYEDETIWKGNAYRVPTKIHDPDLDGSDPAVLIDTADVINDWQAALSTLKNGGREDFTKRIDPRFLVSYLMTCDLCFHAELGHPKSVYLYSENVRDDGFNLKGQDDTPWVMGAMWDCDWSFGYQQNGTYYHMNQAEDFYRSYLGSAVHGLWYRLRFWSQEVDSLYYSMWTSFVNDGRLQELVDYAGDYHAFAARSLAHNSSSACAEKDGVNYATVARTCASWLRGRARHITTQLTRYPSPPAVEPAEDPDTRDTGDLPITGDVNDDGAITVADAVTLDNHLRGLPNEAFVRSRADLDGDQSVGETDLDELDRSVMGQPADPRRQLHLPPATAVATLRKVTARAFQEVTLPVTLTIDEGDYAGLQMDISVPEGVELDGADLSAGMAGMTCRTALLESGTYRLVARGSGAEPLAEGDHELRLRLLTSGSVDGAVAVTCATLSTARGEEERLPATQCAMRVVSTLEDGMAGPAARPQDDDAVYDLAGRRLNGAPRRGVYITRGRKVVR